MTLDLDPIRARLEGTTDGPWIYASGWILVDDGNGHVRIADVPDEGDGELMAHAREDVPALLAEVDAQRAESGRLAQAILTAYQHIAGDDPDYWEAGLVLFAALGFDPDALDVEPAPQDGGVTDPADQSERDGAALYGPPPAERPLPVDTLPGRDDIRSGGVGSRSRSETEAGVDWLNRTALPPEHRGQHPHCDPCILIRDGANRA